MRRLPFPETVDKSPVMPGRLTRDRVLPHPFGHGASELSFDAPEKDVFIAEKNALAWRRKHAFVTDAAGASWPVFVGYGASGDTERVLIGAKRTLFAREFLLQQKAILPFFRVRFSGCAETADVYDPNALASLAGTDYYRWAIFARTEDLLAELGRMAHGKRFVTADEAQSAWEAHAVRAFERSDREARLPDWAYRAQEEEWPVEARLLFGPEHHQVPRFLSYDALERLAPDDALEGVLRRRPHLPRSLRYADRLSRDRMRGLDRRMRIPGLDVPVLEEPEQPFRPLVGGDLQASLPAVQMPGDRHLPRKTVTIPAARPKGAREWARQPAEVRSLSAVDAENWPSLLRLAEGRYYKDIPELRNGVREHRRQTRMQARSEARARHLIGECLDLNIFQEVVRVDVSFGERLLIEGATADGRVVYAVDSPNHGVGLYLFAAADRDAAIAWAAGRCSYQEARARAIRFIPHVDGWDARARDALRMGDEDGDGTAGE